jgi:beta-lactamase class D
MGNTFNATPARKARLISGALFALLISAWAFANQPSRETQRLVSDQAKLAARNIAQQFHLSTYRGSFVTKTDNQLTIWHGADNANSASTPASTFKVFLALVGLETGVLRSVDEIIPWNRQAYPGRAEWHVDMALMEAMQTSSESYFQVLAERIGQQRLATWVKRMD